MYALDLYLIVRCLFVQCVFLFSGIDFNVLVLRCLMDLTFYSGHTFVLGMEIMKTCLNSSLVQTSWRTFI